MVYQVLTCLDFIIFLSILLFPFHILSELRYMCYNAGRRCYGRVHMTPVDSRGMLLGGGKGVFFSSTVLSRV